MQDKATRDDKYDKVDEDNVNKKTTTSEAGALRGMARSLGRGTGAPNQIAMLRLPTIGRLPITRPPNTVSSTILKAPIKAPRNVATGGSITIPRKIPIKRVAKVSDQVSQGISLLDSASESTTLSSTSTNTIREERIARFHNFASSLIKNTILGIVVFEVYDAMLDRFGQTVDVDNIKSFPLLKNTSPRLSNGGQQQPDISSSTTSMKQQPISIHIFGGLLGGSSHGIVASLKDAIATSIHQRPLNTSYMNVKAIRSVAYPGTVWMRHHMPGMVAHHGLSHAVLFGSYEVSKRFLLSFYPFSGIGATDTHSGQVNISTKAIDGAEQIARVEYLSCIVVAGGCAGQAQYLTSLITDRLFLQSKIPTWSFSHWRTLLFPLAMSFLPSSIAFVAYEYGKLI